MMPHRRSGLPILALSAWTFVLLPALAASTAAAATPAPASSSKPRPKHPAAPPANPTPLAAQAQPADSMVAPAPADPKVRLLWEAVERQLATGGFGTDSAQVSYAYGRKAILEVQMERRQDAVASFVLALQKNPAYAPDSTAVPRPSRAAVNEAFHMARQRVLFPPPPRAAPVASWWSHKGVFLAGAAAAAGTVFVLLFSHGTSGATPTSTSITGISWPNPPGR